MLLFSWLDLLLPIIFSIFFDHFSILFRRAWYTHKIFQSYFPFNQGSPATRQVYGKTFILKMIGEATVKRLGPQGPSLSRVPTTLS